MKDGSLNSAPHRHHHGWRMDQRLFAIYDRVFGETHVVDVLREVAALLPELMNCERATIYLVDPDTMELQSVATTGNIPSVIRLPIRKESLAGFCAMTGKAFVVPDAYGDLTSISADLRFDRTWDIVHNYKTRDVMCAPVSFKDRLEGVIQVINGKGTPFSEGDEAALTGIARMIGYSLHHARLYDDLASFKQVEKEKGAYLRVMVHELKSPVAAAKMLSDAMTIKFREHADISRHTSRINARLEQVIEMIGDLLALAKVKEGGALGNVTEFDLREVLSAVCAKYREPAEVKGLAFELHLPDYPVCIRFDQAGCPMVFSNLVSNAIKYTTKGVVGVSLAKADGAAVVEVTDSGMGIPGADVPHLFREFFRASNARRSGIHGSGIGLAGAKTMVDRFGGSLSLTSRENEGSTFTVRIPLCGDTENKTAV